MAEVAKKRDPRKWAAAKAKARKKMGGHSARAMQLATKYYKDSGGTYQGRSHPRIVCRNGRRKTGEHAKITKNLRNE